MQTVYVPVSVEDELPPISTTDKWNKREEISDYHFAKVVDRNGEAMQDSRAQYFYKGGSWSIQGYLGDFKVTHWLKPTEAVLLSKEDADRVVNYQSDKDNEPFGELEKYLVYIKSQARVEICWCPDEKNGKWLAAESYSDTDHYIDNEDIILWASIPMPSPPKPKQ